MLSKNRRAQRRMHPARFRTSLRSDLAAVAQAAEVDRLARLAPALLGDLTGLPRYITVLLDEVVLDRRLRPERRTRSFAMGRARTARGPS